jgi:phosphoribosylformylglycinamidine synthase subunit PurQ / glutaminase
MANIITETKPKVIIPCGVGFNSHKELGYCFELGGAEVDFVLLNDLIANPSTLYKYNGMGLPGGFTMGDDPSAGKSVANRITHSGLREVLKEILDDVKRPTYISCNSDQILAKLNLYPIRVGTTNNECGKHMTGVWDVKANESITDNCWINGLRKTNEPVFAHISHGEGRFYVPDNDLKKATAQNLIALTYDKGKMYEFYKSFRKGQYNPNGSTADIAGFGWANNLVLFPHFERLQFNYQRPDKADLHSQNKDLRDIYEPTYFMFKEAVDLMKKNM